MEREEIRSRVAVCAHPFAKLQKALLGSESAGAPFGTADGTEEDVPGVLCGGEGLVADSGTVGIDGALRENVRPGCVHAMCAQDLHHP